MTLEEDVVSDLFLFQLPHHHRPGSDRCTKQILNRQPLIDIISNELLDVPPSVYTTGNLEWNDNSRSDVLLIPRENFNYPPILIEIQQIVNETFLQRVIRYSLNVCDQYGRKPIVLIFAVTRVQPQSFHDTFNPTSKSYIHSTSCTHWASKCLLLAPHTTTPIVDEVESPLDPLLAISLFLTQREVCLALHTHSEDSTIQLLYAVAKTVMTSIMTFEENYQQALSSIHNTTAKLLERIQKEAMKLQIPTNKLSKRIASAVEYNNRVKFQLIDSDSSDASSVDLPPRKRLIGNKRSDTEAELSFVTNFRNSCEGRMDWKLCHQEGKKLGLFKSFRNAESLRVVHSRHSQQADK